MRYFPTGATRNDDKDKLDFEGFLSPAVLERFAQYMHLHRIQEDGSLRASDNWQKGMTLEAYMKSGWRHFHDWWMEHRGQASREGLEDALCGLLFNVQGYLFEILKQRDNGAKTVSPSTGVLGPRSAEAPLGMGMRIWEDRSDNCGCEKDCPPCTDSSAKVAGREVEA